MITKEGITIGLTGSNTAGMSFSKLTRRSNAIDPRDWAPVDCCMSVDGATCTVGRALIDTGVSQMYMTLPLGTAVHRTNSPLLDDGSIVEVQLGKFSDFVASDIFTVGDVAGMKDKVVRSSVRVIIPCSWTAND